MYVCIRENSEVHLYINTQNIKFAKSVLISYTLKFSADQMEYKTSYDAQHVNLMVLLIVLKENHNLPTIYSYSPGKEEK